MSLHPNDKLSALDWSIRKAHESAKTDELVRLSVLPALQQLREEALREVRGGAA